MRGNPVDLICAPHKKPAFILTTFLKVTIILASGACVAQSQPPDALLAHSEQVPTPEQRIDLSALLAVGKLRPVNRNVAKLPGSRDAVHVDDKAGVGVVWIEGTEFSEGTIDVDVRGRDILQRSFVGVAFHREDDGAYEAVYVRPFNIRAEDPDRHMHAIQYMATPDYDWPRLRQEFPNEFENSVDSSVTPTDWVHLRVVVKDATISIYAGSVKSTTLKVRKLGQHDRGMVGLWAGNNSDGDFADLQITPKK
jgi:hypothetical protein